MIGLEVRLNSLTSKHLSLRTFTVMMHPSNTCSVRAERSAYGYMLMVTAYLKITTLSLVTISGYDNTPVKALVVFLVQI